MKKLELGEKLYFINMDKNVNPVIPCIICKIVYEVGKFPVFLCCRENDKKMQTDYVVCQQNIGKDAFDTSTAAHMYVEEIKKIYSICQKRIEKLQSIRFKEREVYLKRENKFIKIICKIDESIKKRLEKLPLKFKDQ